MADFSNSPSPSSSPSNKPVVQELPIAQIVSELEMTPLNDFRFGIRSDTNSYALLVAMPNGVLEIEMISVEAQHSIFMEFPFSPNAITYYFREDNSARQISLNSGDVENLMENSAVRSAYKLANAAIARYTELERSLASVMQDLLLGCMQPFPPKDMNGRLSNIKSKQIDNGRILQVDLDFEYRPPRINIDRLFVPSTSTDFVLKDEDGKINEKGQFRIYLNPETRLIEQPLSGAGQITMIEHAKLRCHVEGAPVDVIFRPEGACGKKELFSSNSSMRALYEMLCLSVVGDVAPQSLELSKIAEWVNSFAHAHSAPLNRLQALEERVREVLLYFLGGEPVSDSDLVVGDFVMYATAVNFETFMMEVFEIGNFGAWRDSADNQNLTLTFTEKTSRGRKQTSRRLNSRAGNADFIESALLPTGERGFLTLISNGRFFDAIPGVHVAVGEQYPEAIAQFNQDMKSSYEMAWQFNKGELVARRKIKDPLMLSVERAINHGMACREDLFKGDPFFDKVEGEIGDESVFRKLKGAFQVDFSLPGFFRLPEMEKSLFASYISCYRSLNTHERLSLYARNWAEYIRRDMR